MPRQRAAALVKKLPNDVEVLLLYANAMAALRDPEGAIEQIEEALRVNPNSSPAYVSLGAVRMQSGDAKEAEAAFRRAIELEPASMDARLALANFMWAAGRQSEAEVALKEALVTEPQHLLANRMLGVMYLATKRIREAEQPLKAVAEISKAPAARLQLADYYTSVGRTQEATDLLTPLVKDQTVFVDVEVEAGGHRLRGRPYGRGSQTRGFAAGACAEGVAGARDESAMAGGREEAR